MLLDMKTSTDSMAAYYARRAMNDGQKSFISIPYSVGISCSDDVRTGLFLRDIIIFFAV